MEFHKSAFKHDIKKADVEHALKQSLLSFDVDDELPQRSLHLGPDRHNNFLEIIDLEFDDGRLMAIHAMKMRSQFAELLLEHVGGDNNE